MRRENSFALGVYCELVAVTQNSAGRPFQRKPDDIFFIKKICQNKSTQAQTLNYRALIFIAGPTHIFQKYRDVEFAPARNFSARGGSAFGGKNISRCKFNSKPDVHFKLSFQIFPNLSRGDKFSFTPAEGRIIYQKIKRDCRLVYFNCRKRF